MKKKAPIPFAGCQPSETRDLCVCINSDDEAYRVLLFFITDGGILQQNPFFVPPEEFLRELSQRRAARTGGENG